MKPNPLSIEPNYESYSKILLLFSNKLLMIEWFIESIAQSPDMVSFQNFGKMVKIFIDKTIIYRTTLRTKS